MSGLGGLNKSPDGMMFELAQMKLPVVDTPDQLAEQTQRIFEMTAKAKRGLRNLDLTVGTLRTRRTPSATSCIPPGYA
ncbi:hypothetical protein [Cohnella thermotolerans]|uniref:hypothetical protein n=1 Tax=Cohnella thermotolerans TaxID=329858 RepID=UPI00040D79C5|nr:hypothetical protein [Cohnella thermotolerans]